MQVLQGEDTNVNKFLRSIGRNSRSTEEIYKTGITHFSRFLKTYNDGKLSSLTPDLIISELRDQRLNVYELLNEFVSYLLTIKKLSIKSVKLYVTIIKSYLEFYDIDIVPAKFRRRVKVPKHYREDEFPLDISDIRNLLVKCHNVRLKTFLLVLASSGCRVMEVCSLRLRDVDFTVNPTRIHIRKEYTKTRRSRDVYISDEATRYLRSLIDSRTPKPTGDNLIFSKYKKDIRSRSLYFRLCTAFDKLLEEAGMDEMKENSPRHKITLHSIRRWVKGVVSDQAGQDYSEWFLGHDHSVYWTRKEQERRNIYLKKCMSSLTVLDYTALDTQQKNIQAELQVKDKQIQTLTQRMEEMEEFWSRSYDELKTLVQDGGIALKKAIEEDEKN